MSYLLHFVDKTFLTQSARYHTGGCKTPQNSDTALMLRHTLLLHKADLQHDEDYRTMPQAQHSTGRQRYIVDSTCMSHPPSSSHPVGLTHEFFMHVNKSKK